MSGHAILMLLSDSKSSATSSDIVQCVGIAVGVNIAIPVLCALRLLGHMWATRVALSITLFSNVFVPLLILRGVMPSFEGIYTDARHFLLTNHMLVLFYGLVQSALLAVSLYADRISFRRT